MMLPDPRNLAVFVILAIVAYLFLCRFWRNLSSNLQLIADLLHGEIRYPVLNLPLYFVVEGLYKGRKVACYCNPLGSGKWHGDTKFSIEPNGGIQESSFFSSSKDGPTDVTYIVGNKIYCGEPVSAAAQRNPLFSRANLFRPITKQDLIAYLDRLSDAAEQVENGACRIRTTA